MRVIGLTGGIGSGKSYVADRLAERGAAIVDTDAIAHEITAPGGAAIPKLVETFGAGILRSDGAMDRDAMRALAFSDATAKSRLEQITHPLIREIALSRGAAAQASGAHPYTSTSYPCWWNPWPGITAGARWSTAFWWSTAPLTRRSPA